MDIPRFTPENINPRFAVGNIGDAFQVFVYEVLRRDYPELHQFPAGGKDGGIDLTDSSTGKLVFECKVVGLDGAASVEQRWKGVSKHLAEHLQDPSGPTPGQAQYGPWYSTDKPITEYRFCVSASIANDQQRGTLEQSIAEFFQTLARQYPHLAHLSGLTVKVVDWNDLSGKLREQPHLIFRWFPGSRPNGLVPLEESLEVGTFRSYLTDAKLPYYSVAEHLRSTPAPPGHAISDEETLLQSFDNPEITGLVITGKGGVGKSRLTLQLGWLGVAKGWTVMRVQRRLKENGLEKFAETLTPDTPALLLIDYIETQTDFGELVETINVLNDSGVARIRYVAACRTNFYHRAVAASERHLPVDLTPPPGSATLDWFASYRHQTVEKILAKAGLPENEKYLAVCNNVPILAVFLSYLHTAGRNEDLAELLAEVEFGRWVAKRVQLTFPGRNVARELALLIPMFPMQEPVVEQLSQTIYREVFDELATDGWIEKVPPTEAGLSTPWVTAHDVLADQILLAFARSIPHTIELFVDELLSLAANIGCLSSALVALQRVFDTPPLNSVRWFKVISDAIPGSEGAWHDVRDLLMSTTLLSSAEQLMLLRSYERLWTGAEDDPTFQKRLGWLARRVIKFGDDVAGQDKATLVQWIIKAAPLAQRSNFVITWGLRLVPASLKDIALEWIITKPNLLQTHYLMVSWLDSGLDPQPIALFVEQWTRKFSRSFHLTFLLEAWLDAGGDKGLVQEQVAAWLVEHSTSSYAQFVYKAWLDADGDKGLVQDHVAAWLAEHGSSADAQFVYTAWLDARGDKESMQERVGTWLAEHGLSAAARFVYKAWLDAGGDKGFVQEQLMAWLVEYGSSTDAQFVYKAWLDAGGDKGLVQEQFAAWLVEHGAGVAAQFVYKAWLDAGGDKGLVQERLEAWLAEHGGSADAKFVYKAWLDAGGDEALVREGVAAWLTEHGSSADARFVYSAWLDAGGETMLVENTMAQWLVEHARMSEARFVYVAWLNAGGDPALLKETLNKWFTDHRANVDAGFVFGAWLGAGGEREFVWNAAIDWLHKFKTEEAAVYVTKYITKQKQLTTEIVKDVLTWCRTFPQHEDALWRVTRLGKRLSLPDVAAELVFTSEAIFEHLFQPENSLDTNAREQILTIFLNLITSKELQAGPLRERVDELFVRWLRHPRSFGPEPTLFWLLQNEVYLERVAALIRAAILDPVTDFPALSRFMHWLNHWDAGPKYSLLPLLRQLNTQHPGSELWAMVQVPK